MGFCVERLAYFSDFPGRPKPSHSSHARTVSRHICALEVGKKCVPSFTFSTISAPASDSSKSNAGGACRIAPSSSANRISISESRRAQARTTSATPELADCRRLPHSPLTHPSANAAEDGFSRLERMSSPFICPNVLSTAPTRVVYTSMSSIGTLRNASIAGINISFTHLDIDSSSHPSTTSPRVQDSRSLDTSTS